MKASADDKAAPRPGAPPHPRAPEREPEAASGGSVPPRERRMSRVVAQRLQAQAGSRAVAGLLARRRRPAARPGGRPTAVQRLAVPPVRAVEGARVEGGRSGPESDPKFAVLVGDVGG